MTQVARSSRTINWYRTPIGREQLRDLNQASDVKAGLQITAGSNFLVEGHRLDPKHGHGWQQLLDLLLLFAAARGREKNDRRERDGDRVVRAAGGSAARAGRT